MLAVGIFNRHHKKTPNNGALLSIPVALSVFKDHVDENDIQDVKEIKHFDDEPRHFPGE